MPQSLSRNLIHLVYSTKNRAPALGDTILPNLVAYQSGVFRACESPELTIGGTSDHIHALFTLSKNYALSKVVEEVKKSSSKWLKDQATSLASFQWQSGYAAFSVSASHVVRVCQYIERQHEHHRTISFQDELQVLLKNYGLEFDERYVWD